MIEKRLVLRLRPRQPDLDMRRAGILLDERVGHDHLGGVAHRQQCRNRKVVERTPVQLLLDDGVGTVHAVIDGPDPAPAALRILAHLVRRPPFRPQPGQGEMLPHRRTRCGDVELDHGCRGLAGHLIHLPVFFLLPSRFEVAHPARHLADDVDRLPVLDQALGRWIHAHGPDAGLGK